MSIKIYLCMIFTMLSAYAVSAINFEKFLLRNKVKEARILYFIFSFILGYLLTEFVLILLPEGL